MNTQTYELTATTFPNYFIFTSSGPSGDIPLEVSYFPITIGTPTPMPNTYNLGFGVISGDTISDTHVVKNGDTDIILNTVLETVPKILDSYPNFNIFVSGSTPSRTRLYQMKLNRYISNIPENYTIYGCKNGVFEVFMTGQTYNSFLISKNKNWEINDVIILPEYSIPNYKRTLDYNSINKKTLEELGYRILTINCDELAKLGGSIRCATFTI